tara:strand:- start:353 stop:1216 length:864 start_codon:yes stop_codon:yes gene_type:complete
MSSQSYKPLVSIIVNCYNGEKYLYDALKSIKEQTYENWEVIFWDVSDSLKCKNILLSFKEEKFKYFNIGMKKNLYNSRNEAIKQSNGEIISFLDCDDWWEPNKLSVQVPYLQEKSVSIVYSNYYEHNQNTKKTRVVKKHKIFSGFIQKEIIHDYHIGILTTLIKKEIFEKLEGYNNFFHICGDFEFNVRASKDYKIIGLKEPLAHYRVHDQNISKDLNREVIELEYCLKIFKEKKFDNINKFQNFLNYRKCIKNLSERKFLEAFKVFLKINFSIFKLKIFYFIFFRR